MNRFIKVYKSIDLSLVAYLITHGYNYNKTKLKNGRAQFYFDETDQLKQDVELYYHNNDLTSAKAYESNLKAVQRLAYSVKHEGEVD
jgi:hypothetical protein